MTISYKDLIVWQKSIDLIELIYKNTESFPKVETYGIVSQMRRSAVSIASNITEGRCRGTRKDYTQFLRIALGSGAELETQLIISKRLDFIKNSEYDDMVKMLYEIMKMLNVMIRKLAPKS